MKKIVLIILGSFPLVVLAQSGHFKLNIKISGLDKPALVYLTYRSSDKSIRDSARTVSGELEFSGNLSGICKASLTMDHSGTGTNRMAATYDGLTLYLEDGNINVFAQDSIKLGVISGSPVNDQYLVYRKVLSPTEHYLDSIRNQWGKAGAKNKDLNARMEALYRKGLKDRENLQLAFVRQHPDFYISGTLVMELAGPMINLEKLEPLYNGLSDNVRKSTVGLELGKAIEQTRATSVAAMAPLFTQNDTNGHPVKLSDFRGKYVLLDFWASWCGPCRAENPNVVKAYQKYKQKNFTVLSVSLDRPGKKDAWLAAIKADGLEWTQVSDLKFWDNEAAKLYGIRAIPQNFLIDPTGKIIEKNLTGEDLNKKLKEIFGS